MPLEKRQVPILDLTPLDQLMEWSIAIDRFIETGNSGLVGSLTRRGVKPILRQTKGRDKAATAIKNIGNGLDSFTSVLATCRGKKISETAEYLKKEIDKCEETALLPLLNPLLERVGRQMEQFVGDLLLDGLKAARWCYNHKLIQQAYTILQETIIGYFVASVNQDPNDLVLRGIASQAVKISSDDLPEADWLSPAADHKNMTHAFLEFFRGESELIKMMKLLTDYRNDLNHAGHKQNPMPAESFGKKLSDLLARFETYLPEK
jgi:hypothetical protein